MSSITTSNSLPSTLGHHLEDPIMLKSEDDDASSYYTAPETNVEPQSPAITRPFHPSEHSSTTRGTPVVFDSDSPSAAFGPRFYTHPLQARNNGMEEPSGSPPETLPRPSAPQTPVLGARAAPNLRLFQPWGVPATGARTQFPAFFPFGIRQLIGRIPLQSEGPMGRNLRPLVIDIFSRSFTPAERVVLNAVLALAPDRILQDMANTIAALIRALWDYRFRLEVFRLRDVVRQPSRGRMRTWMIRLPDQTWARILGRPYGGRQLWNFLARHVRFSTNLEVDVRVNIGFRRTGEMVRRFVASLVVVARRDLDGNEPCSICLGAYYRRTSDTTGGGNDGVEGETAVPLGCGHVIGRDCLQMLLTPEMYENPTSDKCPLCRRRIEVV